MTSIFDSIGRRLPQDRNALLALHNEVSRQGEIVSANIAKCDSKIDKHKRLIEEASEQTKAAKSNVDKYSGLKKSFHAKMKCVETMSNEINTALSKYPTSKVTSQQELTDKDIEQYFSDGD